MKTLFTKGEFKEYQQVVSTADCAIFENVEVHSVLSTFALARNAEWVCRLFVIDMKEEHEEGIGIFLEIEHLSPALVGQTVSYVGKFETQIENTISCSFCAKVGQRIVAKGRTEQKVLNREKINQIFKSHSGKGN